MASHRPLTEDEMEELDMRVLLRFEAALREYREARLDNAVAHSSYSTASEEKKEWAKLRLDNATQRLREAHNRLNDLQMEFEDVKADILGRRQ